MSEPEFISEPITPEPGSFGTAAMTRGLAALPGAFTWRGRRYEVVRCLDETKRTAREGHRPDGERYLRRQEFELELDSGEIATIYVLRQPPRGAGSRAAARSRWFLYSIAPGAGS